MKNRLLQVKWQVSGKVITQCPCPWLQDHLSVNQRVLKHRRSQPPTQYDNEKSNQPKANGCLPSHPARPKGQKAHKVMHHHPLNNTNTRILKTDLPSNTHRKAHSWAKNYSITVTFKAGGLPFVEDPGFPAVGIPDTKIHLGTAELRAAWGQASRSWLESWVCTPL